MLTYMVYSFTAQPQQGFGEFGGEMAYDLRQSYAKIVGDHLEDIAQARKADKYYIYYKALKDLYIIVKHKFKKGKEKGEDGKIINDEETYRELIKEAVKIANKYENEWLGKTQRAEPCAEIEEALNNIEMFLYEKIEKAGMFGGNKTIPGL